MTLRRQLLLASRRRFHPIVSAAPKHGSITMNAAKENSALHAHGFEQCQTRTTTSAPFYGEPRPNNATEGSSIPPLSTLQRVAVAIHSATTALSDPARADAVASLGEVTGAVALGLMRERMLLDETGRRILREKPVVGKTSIDLDGLLTGSSGNLERSTSRGNGGDDGLTFGSAYASFMEKHGFDPDERSQVKYIADPELAYVMLRYRQCHDFWHALTGLPPTVLGELGLKWLELIQTGLPVAALSATVGSLRLSPGEREILTTQYLPWAIQVGKNGAYLMNVYYEDEFDTNLQELRNRLGIVPAPTIDA